MAANKQNMLPATKQASQEFKQNVLVELAKVRDRLLTATLNARDAFVQVCQAVPTRTRLEKKRVYENCQNEALHLLQHLMLLLETHSEIVKVNFHETGFPYKPPTEAMQPFVEEVSRHLASELAQFEEYLQTLRKNFAAKTFALCEADHAQRAALLHEVGDCAQQVALLQKYMEKLSRVAMDIDRPPFVYIEKFFDLKITRNDYPIATWQLLIMPFLAAVIAKYENLSDVACVPTGRGAVDDFTDRSWRAIRRQRPLLVDKQAGNLQIVDAEYLQLYPRWDAQILQDLKNQGLATDDEEQPLLLLMDRESLAADILKCASKRFILLLLASSNHQNGLIIDTKEKTVEHIEPNGGFENHFNKQFAPAARLFVEQTLNKLGIGQFVYKFTQDACPLFGPQQRGGLSSHGGGYCVAWTALILLARILNPAYSTFEVQQKMIQGRSSRYLNDLVRAFIEFMERVVAENKIDFPGIQNVSVSRNKSASPESPFRGY